MLNVLSYEKNTPRWTSDGAAENGHKRELRGPAESAWLSGESKSRSEYACMYSGSNKF